MKRTFAKLIRRSLVAACLVLGAFLFSTSSAEAQSGIADIGADLDWKSSSEAQQALLNAVTALHGNPQVSVVGSQPYIQVYYFKEIYGKVTDGSSTWQASRDALSIFSGPGASVQENISGVVLSDPAKEALFQVAVGILTN